MKKAEFLDLCELKHLAFYGYRLPGAKDIVGGASTTVEQGIHSGGFVIARFCGEPWSIMPQFSPDIIDDAPVLPAQKINIPLSTPRNVHIRNVEEAVRQIKSWGKGKAVISRILNIKRSLSLSEIFSNLCETYPKAFVFCFSVPGDGIWIGASPELLLKGYGGKLETAALAGTRKSGRSENWDAKNIIEQEMVRDFIVELLKEEGLNPDYTPTFTSMAGPVEHLKTVISSDLPKNGRLLDLLNKLAPTPALGGYPKDKALMLIKSLERHSREYYGGYCGVVEKNGDFCFYVNLRSMKISQTDCALFIGGGITSDSVAEDEWEETCIKSDTLLNCIRAATK